MSSNHGKVETDVEIKAPATKFHEVFTHRPHHISNISSNNIQGCDLHEGVNGAPSALWSTGIISMVNGKAKVSKQLIEAIDAEKNLITFKVIEGDLLEHYKSFKITLQATPKAHGQGSIVHCTVEYEKHHGDIEDPHTLLQFSVDVSKDVDVHLTSAQA